MKITLINCRKRSCPESTPELFAGLLVETNAHRSCIVYCWIIATGHIACRWTADRVRSRNTYSKRIYENDKVKIAWPDFVELIKNVNECWRQIQNHNSTYISNRGHKNSADVIGIIDGYRVGVRDFFHMNVLISLYWCNRKWRGDSAWW